jgi:DNA (cytosine-5)-methyltransferase 1
LNKIKSIPIIDLFAGPGGLGEGFSAFQHHQHPAFQICLSIEKDYHACRTLRLRSFFRKIPFPQIRDAYADFAKSAKTEENEKNLFSCFKEAEKESRLEVLNKELGSSDFPMEDIDSLIRDHLSGAKNWVLIGGPPCQAYSLAGRSRMSKVRKENPDKFERDERHYLYQHYLRIIAKHRPPVFVMENVKGMLSSTIKGKFIIKKIINDLEHPLKNSDLKYNLHPFVKDSNQENLFKEDDQNYSNSFIIKSENFGIPQARHRVIILGVRSDIDIMPKHLSDTIPPLVLRDIISDLPPIRSELSCRGGRNGNWKEHINEIKSICKNGNVNLGVKKQIYQNVEQLRYELSTGEEWMNYPKLPTGRPKKILSEWYRNPNLGGVCNHESRSHMPSDLRRYFFASCFALAENPEGKHRSPVLSDFPKELLPAHNNIDPDNIRKVMFNDRFRVQLWDNPATTITSHISKDGHYFIHPDPRQCRSLSVREAARIQTFPDSYIFLGPRTSQYQQVGNAVPPLLSLKLAEIVFDLMKRWEKRADG